MRLLALLQEVKRWEFKTKHTHTPRLGCQPRAKARGLRGKSPRQLFHKAIKKQPLYRRHRKCTSLLQVPSPWRDHCTLGYCAWLAAFREAGSAFCPIVLCPSELVDTFSHLINSDSQGVRVKWYFRGQQSEARPSGWEASSRVVRHMLISRRFLKLRNDKKTARPRTTRRPSMDLSLAFVWKPS